ncbi:MAG TPA: hypothetical protein VK745_04495 [Polyangiaceae bacterium]|nr:hypothetical protein [Polyangiaceae bacterium]
MLVPLLGSSRDALAQATARFADAPTTSTTSTSVAPSPPAPSPPAPAATPTPLAPEPIQPPAVEEATPSAPQAGFARRLAVSHLERGKALEARSDITQALREYSESIAVDSTLGEAYLRLGALRERMGEPREAELVFSAALTLPDARAKAFLERSHLRRKAGSSALALSDLESAVELDDDRTLLVELAQDYVELHAWSAALAVFRRVVASAAESEDTAGLQSARLEVRALRVLAAETDPSQERPQKHDWVARALRSIARR